MFRSLRRSKAEKTGGKGWCFYILILLGVLASAPLVRAELWRHAAADQHPDQKGHPLPSRRPARIKRMSYQPRRRRCFWALCATRQVSTPTTDLHALSKLPCQPWHGPCSPRHVGVLPSGRSNRCSHTKALIRSSAKQCLLERGPTACTITSSMLAAWSFFCTCACRTHVHGMDTMHVCIYRLFHCHAIRPGHAPCLIMPSIIYLR